MKRQPDISVAKKILGWEPKVMREEGLKLTYEWFKNLPSERLYRQEHRDFAGYSKKYAK
jgi:dTDP-glucose 4,6-dehydratase